MPTFASMWIPPPESWKEFESITLSALRIKWSSPNLTKHGRQGQPQHGVDIYGTDHLGQCVGVQCKLANDTFDIETIRRELTKAEKFKPKLKAFFIATTAPSDAKLQQIVRQLSSKRVSTHRFPVGIFFWDDLIQELVKNEAEFSKHYPQLAAATGSSMTTSARLLSLLDLAYYGLHIRDYMYLSFEATGCEPEEFPLVMGIIEGCVTVLFDIKSGTELINLCRELTNYSMALVLGQEDKPDGWRPANRMAASIERRIANLEYTLRGRELAAFRAGVLLGVWKFLDFTDIERIPPALSQGIINAFKGMTSDSKVLKEVAHNMLEYQRKYYELEGYDIPHRTYRLAKSGLRSYEMKSPKKRKSARTKVAKQKSGKIRKMVKV